MDFDDLLIKLLELLKKDDEVRNHLSQQFRYNLVDEFQDTNVIQASIVQLLAAQHGNVLAVGDDAQSIYSFRAAEIRNMLDFPNLYPGTQIYRLTTNYRSTPQILSVANAVIKHNSEQFSKELKTSCQSGERPALVPAASPSQEAQYVADQIGALLEAGTAMTEIAVLFRSSFHSQSLEFELMRRNIPYEYRGGMKFFERAHIKDAVSHLRLLHNHRDGMAWVRCLKIHPGIGLVTAGNIASACAQTADLDEVFALNQRGAKAQAGWQSCLRVVGALRSAKYPADAIRSFCQTEEYANYLEAEYPDAADRLEDLEQFAVFAEQFQKFEDFLEAVTLTEDFGAGRVDDRQEPEDKIVLSTIHQAKGLEWDQVFVIHLAEGSFPHQRAMNNDADIEEERRLFYVASTRARKNLYLSYPATTGFDTIEVKQPSMFLAEIPEGCYERVRLRQPGWLPAASSARRPTWVEDSSEPVIVLDDLGERIKKPAPKSFLGDY
jgi:DNA helicase-2/ATP-dependent DNA helicase PcrA